MREKIVAALETAFGTKGKVRSGICVHHHLQLHHCRVSSDSHQRHVKGALEGC